MSMKTILVTGAPRSGTTPVGEILADLHGAITLYEPMGPTGDRRFPQRFPIPGESGFTTTDLATFVSDLAQLRLAFKAQKRAAHRSWRGRLARVIGTRSLISYRRARLQPRPRRRILIWKDPHAVFCAPKAASAGFRAVVTVRPPHAHAASFKRLGWICPVAELYARYREAFGDIPELEPRFERAAGTPAGSATILWRMIYEQFCPDACPVHSGDSIYLLNMQATATDEVAAYERLFQWLGEDMPERTRRKIAARATATRVALPAKGRVHDWNRSASQANSYWPNVLDDSEVSLVDAVNGALWEAISSREGVLASSSR